MSASSPAAGHAGGDGGPLRDDEPIVELRGVSKRYGSVEAVKGLELDVAAGELITLLGPSGCGKTTAMRIVAGFERPDAGEVRIQGSNVIGVPPNKRPVNMVFQQYALFPHLDVLANVEFGLRLKGVPRRERSHRALDMLHVVGLHGLEARLPEELSGGQAQRVALARALVNRPAVLLLDEPLSALDLKIRQQMQTELKRVHAELGTTFLYVTHDQEEAMILSDRVVLMRDGQIEQIGTPEELYTHPTSVFSAQFVGDVNLLAGTVTAVEANTIHVDVDETNIRASNADGCGAEAIGQEVTVAIRPEAIELLGGETADTANRLIADIIDMTFVGDRIRYRLGTGVGTQLQCQRPRVGAPELPSEDRGVVAAWSSDAATVIFERCPVRTGAAVAGDTT